jgi:hypothetical protein
MGTASDPAFVDGKQFLLFRMKIRHTANGPLTNRSFVAECAVGGSWGGLKGIDDTIFPQTMEVDYVRVYQKKK